MDEPTDDRPIDRAVLDEWPRAEAAAGFADAVMERIAAEDAAAMPRRGRWWKPVLAFGAGVAVMALLALWLGSKPAVTSRQRTLVVAGSISGEGARTVEIGAARVSASAGVELRWGPEAGGARVDQRRGVAFYRVDEGDGPFVVRTPQALIEVTGTCFTADVSAARTDITVHEGSVRVTHGGELALVASGHRLRATRQGLGRPREQDDVGGESAAAVDLRPALQAPAECRCAEEVPAFEPPQDDLEQWAEECRVRYDVSPLGFDDEMLSQFAVDLGVDGAERAVVLEVARAVEARADRELARIYVDATGDDTGVQQISPDLMFDEVLRSADVGEAAAVRRKLSRERAGLDPVPDRRLMTPYEELMRALARSGDDLQRELAGRLGERRAAELRTARGGWPGLVWNAAGCPGR